MPLERSHGKARPILPRSSDLAPVASVPNPSEGRGPAGRFAPGNRLSINSGQKHAIKRLMGGHATDEEVLIVARDAERAFRGTMRDLPSDGATVRSLAALYSRHVALAAYYTRKAENAGLDSPEGLDWTARATGQGQRAERIAVTALDVATKLAAAQPRSDARPPWEGLAVDVPANESGDE